MNDKLEMIEKEAVVAYVYLAFAWGDSREPQKTCQLDLSEI
jgi:hypothetical protein